jgi:hypothetical protein
MSEEFDFFRRQLASVPVRNAAVEEFPSERDGVDLNVPMAGVWRGLIGSVLPISRDRRIALDALGREVLAWCDGKATVGDLVERHRREHALSFFESRAMLLAFFQLMMKRGVLVMRVPQQEEKVV